MATSAPDRASRAGGQARLHRRGLAVGLVLLPFVAVGACSTSPAPPRPVERAPRVLAAETVGLRMRDLVIDSPALDQHVPVRLLLPRRFEAEPGRRWPVLWLLHGCCDSYESWTRSTDLEELPGLDEVLVVLPDGGHVGFYSDWLEGSQGGPARWETFHLTELRQLLERDWRAGPRRAVAGLSMGGLGAMAYAARHPGMFQAAASYSGLLHTRYQGDPSSGAGSSWTCWTPSTARRGRTGPRPKERACKALALQARTRLPP